MVARAAALVVRRRHRNLTGRRRGRRGANAAHARVASRAAGVAVARGQTGKRLPHCGARPRRSLGAGRSARRWHADLADRRRTWRQDTRYRVRTGARIGAGDPAAGEASMSGTFAIVGLGTMGRNLALNIEEHGFPVVVWNLETEWTDAFLKEHAGAKFTGARTLETLVSSLDRPRRIMMMIPAGKPVDDMIAKLTPLLDAGDIIIDGGNSYFEDTRRREALMREKQLNFVGCGVSGGEDGARFGPSIMPGGSDAAWARIKDVLEAIAAKTEAGPCVTHVGADGAGHFVKMVHNGIEYGDMQIIAETYDVLHRGLGLTTPEAGRVFAEWNRGTLESFLVELTAHVCNVVDPETGQPLVDVIEDKAGQKGTGKWTAQVALELAVAIPTISAAIDARVLSSLKEQRVAASKVLVGPLPNAAARSDRQQTVSDLRDALYAARICG